MQHRFTMSQVRNLQRGTRAVLLFGILTSVAANVLHSLTRPEAASEPDWRRASAAALSALAPLVLFACTELVSRVPVHSKVLSTARLIVTFAVGGFAAWVSYTHMQSVAYLLGETQGTQYVYPLIIDGMMIVATISLIELGRTAGSVQQAEQAAAVAAAQAAKAEAAAAAAAAEAEAEERKANRRRSRPPAANRGGQNHSHNRASRPRPPKQPVPEMRQDALPDDPVPVSPAPAGVTTR